VFFLSHIILPALNSALVHARDAIAHPPIADTVFLLFGGFLVAICMEKW
jgi:hypothetical protein